MKRYLCAVNIFRTMSIIFPNPSGCIRRVNEKNTSDAHKVETNALFTYDLIEVRISI